MKNRLAKLAAEGRCYNLRPFSDDYRENKEVEPFGSKYSITIRDVGFQFTSDNGMAIAYISHIDLNCDRVIMATFDVMRKKIEWVHHSEALEAHLQVALDRLLARIATRKTEEVERKAQQKAADVAQAAERKAAKLAHEAAVLARFGITKTELT